MTTKEIALNWWMNDRTDAHERKITLDEAKQYIDWMEEIPDGCTPETFMEAWNEIVDEEARIMQNMD